MTGGYVRLTLPLLLLSVAVLAGCVTEGGSSGPIGENASFEAGEEVVFREGIGGWGGESTGSVVDPDGAEVWRGEVERNASFRVPLNAEPGAYELRRTGGGVVDTFTVENQGVEPWRIRDPEMRERYVYPNAIGTGEIDDWRTSSRIQRTAERVTRNASGRAEAFRALAEYTAEVVENPASRTFTQVVPPTQQSIRIERTGTVQGDCTEAAVLLIALSRSSGIPARYVMDGGLETYGGDDSPGLDGHAWVEGYVDGEWVMADPSPKNRSLSLTYGSPETLLEGKMATAQAAYVPTGDEYVLGSHIRPGWSNGRGLAERYVSKEGYLLYDLGDDRGKYYDLRFTWSGEGSKVVLQSSTETTPTLYVSKQSVSDGRYEVRFDEDNEWRELPQDEFQSAR